MEEQKRVWFEKHESGGGGKSSGVLQPPEEVLKAHQRFKNKLRKALRVEKREVHIASTKEDLDKQIKETQDGFFPHLVAQQNLDDATKSQDIYHADRTHGAKRVGRWAQEFANGFSQFVSAYSGIIDVVQNAAGPYGDVAYQTLSIFLIVVVNKSSNDIKIKDLLDDMRKSFPRLENWADIYPTTTMRKLVADAYEQVIEFSRAATEYFTHFLTRFTLAIIAPPSTGVDKIAALIHKTLAEINSEAMYKLHGRSQDIQTQVNKSGQHIEELKAQVTISGEKIQKLQVYAERMEDTNDWLRRALQEQSDKFDAYKKEVEQRAQQEDEQRLKTLEEELGVTFPSPETNVEETKRYLKQVFPNSPRYVAHMPETAYVQMNRALLQKTEIYRSWISSTDSCLLFLSGKTAYDGRHYRGWSHCWLSPAAIYITEDLAREDIHVAFFSCHPGLESKVVPTKQIISSIILQILMRKPHILREKAVQFHSAALSDPFRNSANTKTQARAMMKLLGDVLAAVKDLGTTFIVLDRLDQCEGKFKFVMDELVRLVGNPACNVKIAVIAETSIGGGEWDPDMLSEVEYKVDRVFRRQDWNQARLTNLELNRGERPLTWTSEGSTLSLGDVTA
ncbi:uncharacterized protein LY89DRAFT_717619 [Mollisia scopiformis]|uniref:Fungal STAND N-terminal Goodbye domain-containing protein n=1 Tax=Mollisia scopiformis TaxID=149040 RepID=A0A194XE06_MOLSC|nr:uncharacterized protein LY89DRAFT_717619 [Mollisia scopiformis]KUJ17982.1 hypothetical protein LY89DRAFT_717619 [Mollisia scopiformis]